MTGMHRRRSLGILDEQTPFWRRVGSMSDLATSVRADATVAQAAAAQEAHVLTADLGYE
jgi:hypothetical protein